VGYYVRAFCTSSDVPPLRAVFDWAEGRGVSLQAPSADLDARGWEQAEVVYKPDRQPFVVDANTGELLREEVVEFVEFLEDADESPEKQNVLDHLEQSKAVVAAQLLGDIDDDGYTAVRTFLAFYVEHRGGLIQADHEGFYEGDRLIVGLD
jgi:hypothetical protein